MSYTKHNFAQGNILYAADLNAMEDQIAINTDNLPIKVTISSVSSLSTTRTVSGITADMICYEATLSNPSAQTSDWTVTTAANQITISGSISGTTDITLLMGPCRTATAS